jgi:hypothetical protein
MSFQKSVSVYSGVGQAGQPASNSPIIAAAGGPGAFQAGANGLIMARFAWRDATNPKLLNNSGTGKPVGFVMNNANATIGYLEGSSMTIPAGREASPVVGGDFWAVPYTGATPGQKVFADLTNGTIATGAAGSTIDGMIETDWTVTTASAGNAALIVISSWSKA